MIGVYRTQGGKWAWASVITDALEAPGRWILLEAAAPERLVKTVNEREAKALRDGDVRLEARIVNAHLHNGRRRGDIYVRVKE